MTFKNFKLHVSFAVGTLLFVGVLNNYAEGTGMNNGRLIDHPVWLLFLIGICVVAAKKVAEYDPK